MLLSATLISIISAQSSMFGTNWNMSIEDFKASNQMKYIEGSTPQGVPFLQYNISISGMPFHVTCLFINNKLSKTVYERIEPADTDLYIKEYFALQEALISMYGKPKQTLDWSWSSHTYVDLPQEYDKAILLEQLSFFTYWKGAPDIFSLSLSAEENKIYLEMTFSSPNYDKELKEFNRSKK